jgi:CHAD domain-containing protein
MRFDFIIPEQLEIDAVEACLHENLRLQAEPHREIRRGYYDTFDWRLYANGTVLEAVTEVHGYRLVLRHLNDHKILAQMTLPAIPGFASDLPPGQLRQLLEPVLEMRELQAIIRTRSRDHNLRVLNKNDKTVVRLVISQGTAQRRNGRKSWRLDNRVVVIPVKGYPKPLHQTTRLLEDLGLEPATEEPFLKILARVGETPGDYNSKLKLDLTADMRADQATRVILHQLLDTLLVNEAGTRAGTDTEFLHDFRVAVRRTRSALTQIKGVLPARIVNRYKTEFAWLGQVTTPVRDLDVYLLNFDDYRDSLPASVRKDIEPLRTFLQRHHGSAHRALVRALDSARYRRLVNSWREFLEQPVPERSTLQNARRPVLEVACERVWRIYRRTLREGRAIDPQTPAEALHELRKTCKKLRYLMEFFQSLFPAGRIKALIKVLKTLQDNLGEFQDYEVQVTALKHFSHQMVAEIHPSPDTLLAMGMLIEGLERRQHMAREEFAGRFTHFALPENQEHFRELFAKPAA